MLSTAWYVVYSKPQKEELAQFHLRLRAVETFFPRLQLPRIARKRKRIVPLFPNYIFVRINLESEYYRVLWSPGVNRFVSFDESPVPLDDDIAEYLMQQADSDGIITACSTLKVGQEVRVCGGSFDGLMGMLLQAPDAKGRVKVLMNLLSRDIQVELPVHLVSGTWVPRGNSATPKPSTEVHPVLGNNFGAVS